MIDRLLRSLSPAEFLERHFTRVPHVEAGAAGELARLGTPERVAAILDRPDADALAAREGRLLEAEGPLDAARAEALRADGHTILVRHAERHDAELAALAGSFAAAFGAPVDVHVYWSPAGGQGFTWHYDAEDVFVVQTRGEKAFSLRKNTVNPWPLVETIPRDMRFGAERALFGLECTLAPGDWLYIPTGFWHQARARTDAISIAVGVLAPSAIDALDAVRRRLLRSVFWRQRLPVAGSASPLEREERLEHYRAILAELGRDLVRELTDERFVASLADGAAGASPPAVSGRPATG